MDVGSVLTIVQGEPILSVVSDCREAGSRQLWTTRRLTVKVTAVKPYPIRDAEGKGYFIVKVETDEGIYGLGEVGIPNWGGAIAQAVGHLSEVVIGQDPWSTERLWQQMFRGGFFPADKVYCCAISAIDIALWDIKGKAAGLPVYKLLGGPVRDKVVCYKHTQGRNNEELLENCRQAVAEGWKFVRWGQPETGGAFEYHSARDPLGEPSILEPVESILLAEEQMGLVREAVGPDIQICLDVHTRLDTAHVITLCRALEKFNPFFIEDPLRSENPASYRTLARHVSSAHRGWGAVGVEMVVQGGDRGGADQLCPHRPVHSGRADGGAEDNPLGGDALHRHRSAQSAGAGQRGGVRESVHGVHERGGAGDAAASGELRDGPVPGADRVGQRVRVGAGQARSWGGLRRGARDCESGAAE